MNPFHTPSDLASAPTNSPETKCAVAAPAAATTDQTPPTANESQPPQKPRRPTDLLPLHAADEDKSTNQPTEQLTELVNECRISACSRCNGNCACDRSAAGSAATGSAPPATKSLASRMTSNGVASNSGNRAESMPASTATASTATAGAAVQPQGSGSLKSSANKCVGPTPSPPHVPIFVNRFPNTHPTILPPHIR